MDEFEDHRQVLFGIAYRMLASVSDAEDIVQDAYLRYAATPRAEIRSTRAFLTTIVTRLCLNYLQSARVQRESYIGPWLPEPLVSDNHVDSGAFDEFDDEQTISVAFLVLLETLAPLARAVFLLREVFDYDYAEIAEIVDREEAACRQIFSRARKDLTNDQRRFQPSAEAHQRIVASFLHAVTEGDMHALTDVLSADVVLWADGGGKARGAATRPVHGSAAVATFLLSTRRFVSEHGVSLDFATINASQGLILRDAGKPIVVMTFEIEEERIRVLRLVANPDKLTRVR